MVCTHTEDISLTNPDVDPHVVFDLSEFPSLTSVHFHYIQYKRKSTNFKPSEKRNLITAHC